MSKVSAQLRDLQVDTQSVQSVQAQSAQSTSPTQSQQQQQQQQQQTSSQTGRGERQYIQRSSSSASSRSGRPKGGIATGSYQQYSAEGVYGASNGSLGSAVSGERRQGRYRRQVIRLPDQAQGQVRQVRHRLPTPEPDTLERVYIQRTAGEVVEEITEIPTTPPPRIQERTVVEPAGPPQVVKRTIRVPPRGGGYGGYQQQQQGASFQASSGLLGTPNYGSVPQATGSYQQQGAGSYQQQAGLAYSGGYGGSYGSSYGGSYGAVGGAAYGGGGGYQQPVQEPIVFSVGGAGSSQPLPPVGCHPAFCFYV